MGTDRWNVSKQASCRWHALRFSRDRPATSPSCQIETADPTRCTRRARTGAKPKLVNAVLARNLRGQPVTCDKRKRPRERNGRMFFSSSSFAGRASFAKLQSERTFVPRS
jgi:hypothetical protein